MESKKMSFVDKFWLTWRHFML